MNFCFMYGFWIERYFKLMIHLFFLDFWSVEFYVFVNTQKSHFFILKKNMSNRFLVWFRIYRYVILGGETIGIEVMTIFIRGFRRAVPITHRYSRPGLLAAWPIATGSSTLLNFLVLTDLLKR